MKNKKCSKIYSFLIFAIVSTIVIFSSCSKEEAYENINPQNDTNYQLHSDLKKGITIYNDMMVFESKESFDKKVDLLENESANYIEQYFLGKESLSEEALNSQMEKDNFNPFAVYEIFEAYYSFSTVRAMITEKENEWLETSEELNINNNPTFYPLSERCRNIANIDGEYMIGSTIYRVESDGLVYEIRNSDYEALELIRCDKYDIFLKSNNPNVIIHRREVRSNLKSAASACEMYNRPTPIDYHYTSNRKMHCIIDLDFDGYGSASKAKALCYKYEKNWRRQWKWKRHLTSMKAQSIVHDYDSGCNLQKSRTSGIKNRNKAYYISVHIYGGADIFRVKPNDVGGIFYKDGYAEKVLQWN